MKANTVCVVMLCLACVAAGYAAGVLTMLWHSSFDERLVWRCRRQIEAVGALREPERSRAMRDNEQNPALNLRWRIMNAIAGVETP